MCFINSKEQDYLKQRKPISTLKNPSSRKYLILKLTPFSQGKKALDAAASNIHGFL
jgi:hypothetical protein